MLTSLLLSLPVINVFLFAGDLVFLCLFGGYIDPSVEIVKYLI